MSSPRRRHLLFGLVLLLAVVAAVILADVLATVFFAVTVAYVLVPVHRRLVARHGVSSGLASAIASLGAFIVALLLFLPVVAILYFRRNTLLAMLRDLPTTLSVDLFGYSYALETGRVLASLTAALSDLAIETAQAAPVLAIKLSLFVIVVFALLVQRRQLADALLAPVPRAYHDIVAALHERTSEVLTALYVLQAATAVGTFVVAWPLFAVLGYRFAGTLAVVAAALQFLPIVGPSVLVLLVGGYELVLGVPAKGVAVLVLGMVLIAWLPDVFIRPRLAKQTAGLPGSLYFVGFTGGLLGVGAIGVIAGPLAVALLAEAMTLLAAELDD